MSQGRSQLNEQDAQTLEYIKGHITAGITELLEQGVRPANIQIELEWHIKKLLKPE